MGQKINPVGLRLQVNRTWESRWFSNTKEYGDLLHEDLEIRQLNGCGIRSEVFNSKNISLSIGSGAMHDFERLTSKEESSVIRSTSYITALKSFNKKNLVSFTIYYQPLFSNMNDYRTNMESSIRTELLSFWNIYLDSSINYLYDTKPPNNIETKDLIIKTSLVYSW